MSLERRWLAVSAGGLLSRQPLEGAEIRSVGHSALIAVSEMVGAGLSSVVALQVIAAAGAAVALIDLGRRLQGPVAGWVTAFVLVINPLPLIGLFSGCAVGHWLKRLRPGWSVLLADAPAS